MPIKVWSAEEDEHLRELWDAGAAAEEMVEALGRSKNSIYAHAKMLCLEPRRELDPWTRTDLDTLRSLFARGLSDEELAEKLDRPIAAVVTRRRELGLLYRPNKKADKPTLVVGPARICQWIEGDYPRGVVPPICGKRSVAGRSYCAEHAARAYRPAGAPPLPKKTWKEPLRTRSAGTI